MPDRGRLHPQRHVLGDERDVGALRRQGERDRQDPRVVAVGPESRRQHRMVGVVQLDAYGAAGVVDRDRRVEPTVRDSQFVEPAERGAGEIAELRMIPLGLQLGNDHERQHDIVLGEASERGRIGQKYRCVHHVRPTGRRNGGRSGWAGPGAANGGDLRCGGRCLGGRRFRAGRTAIGHGAAPAGAHLAPGSRSGTTESPGYGVGCGPRSWVAVPGRPVDAGSPRAMLSR